MIDSHPPQPIPAGSSSRYRVELLHVPEVRETGVAHQVDGARDLLPWSRVLRALAAEVGEPEGVRTIVFDLITEIADGSCRVCRLDAEPGYEAQGVASAIAIGVGPERCDASLKNSATDGYPGRWFPDLEAFEEAARDSLGPPPAAGETPPDSAERKSWGQRDWRDKAKEWAEP